ncbi:conserved hypothetical protein [Gloeothece citriformis PCC 7424]|uniref:DUF3288 family protein n=1 Tax=Gloeothece citriformis (strain PCC 7424) TaxID=65393 RepID=B7KF32_GLOC7|nr:DUF3288 family protein [Gloeothece citriformis]ACK70488.1 conserved hypothetical protein [Gloeothece citriformis PCC 7424]
MSELQEQKHPQEKTDRELVNRLLSGEATEENLLDLARLRIRYYNFPGARDIQKDLEFLLQKWQLTEEELYQKSRQIYTTSKAYQIRINNQQEDWS